MKTMKTLLAVCIMAMATTASAQFANNSRGGDAPRASKSINTAGYDRIYVSYNPVNVVSDKDNVADINYTGFSAGYTHGFSISQKLPFFVEVGAKLTYAFYSTDESDEDDKDVYCNFKGDWAKYDCKHTYMGVTVPVNLAYSIDFANSEVNIVPYFGLTFKANIIANEKADPDVNYTVEKDEKEKDYFDKKDMGDKDYTWKRFQMGWQIGAGLNYKALYVGVHYGKDFMEIAKKTKMSNWGISLGYNF